MKETDLDKRVLDYIIRDVQISVARLGVNTTISTRVEQDYRKQDFLKIVSTPFLTMPVLFKEIRVDGRISIVELDETRIKVYIRLGYTWKHFDGGSNGYDLGGMIFIVEKNIPKDTEDIFLYIDKERGLEI